MKEKANISKFLIFILIFCSMTPSLLFTSNKIILQSSLQLDVTNISVNQYETVCYKKSEILEALNSNHSLDVIRFNNRDIYLSTTLNNLFCLGNVVDVSILNNEAIVYLASNPKVTTANFVSWIILFSLIIFLRLKKKTYYLIPLVLLFYLSQNVVSNGNFGLYTLVTSSLTSMVLIITGLFYFDRETFKELNLKLFTPLRIKFNSLYIELPENKIEIFANLINFLLIISVLILGYFKKFKFFGSSLMFNDNLIQIYTSAKMHYFNQTSFEAALNQHTPIIPYIYKYVYHLFEYEKFEIGFSFVIILISLFSALFIYLICLNILKYKIISFQISIFFFIFMLNGNALNRDLGILIYLVLIFNLLRYFQTENLNNLIAIIFFSILQIYNLESNVLTIFFINLSILFFSKTKTRLYKVYIIVALVSFTILYGSFFINSEISFLLDTNYLFHLQNISPDFNNASLFNAIGYTYENNINLKHITFLAIIFLIIKNLKDKKFKFEKLEFILLGWFLVEVLALVITGPRFWNYGINLILPTLLIFIHFFSKYLNNNRTHKFEAYAFSFIFMSLFFITQITDLYDYQNTEKPQALNYENSTEILSLLNTQETEKPQLLLTWIHPGDWEWFYNSKTVLPSTKYWWWFFMRYSQSDMYIWDKNWDIENIINDFYNDLYIEQPEYAIINTGIENPPEYFQYILNEYYIEVYEDSKFKVFKKNKLISF